VPVDLADTDLSQFWLGALGGAHGDEVRRQQYQSYQPILLPLDGPVLDIGCGSGDWLAYLAEQGETAVGIDNNRHEIARCRARGLHAEQADAFEWLQAHTRQYAAITLMQVIEHVPRPRLGELLAAISAALRPGGLLLMETVNPAHPLALSVFYNDPTHQRPLPVEYLGFLCQSVGLRPQQTLYTYPLEVAVTAAHWQTPHYMNYALLLRKP
jgi:O-antigen chain-terminating methyltransferase